MDADTDDCAERHAAVQTMTIEVRNDVPAALDNTTKDLVSIGERIDAIGLIVSFGDPDGYEEYLATHWGEPGAPYTLMETRRAEKMRV